VDRLSKDEMALWHAWKRASEVVRARIVEETAAGASAPLSDPDFGVLTRVAEDGGGVLRQNQLAESMGWHRSRLSHHLTRMEQRGLIARRPVDDGVEVRITDAGRALVTQTRPLHAAAVRRHLLNPIGKAGQADFLAALERLLAAHEGRNG
jgi:DNA-binding MarR family transcriptional regulator